MVTPPHSPYRHRQSWMDNGDNEHFEQPFPGFVKLWLDDSWEDVIRLAIHWYIEANDKLAQLRVRLSKRKQPLNYSLGRPRKKIRLVEPGRLRKSPSC